MKKKDLIKVIKEFALNNIERDGDGDLFGEDLNELFNIIERGVMEEIEKENINIIF